MVRLFDEAESDKRPTVKHYLAVIVLRIFELVRIVKLGSVDATLTPATTTLTPRTTKRRSLSRSSSRQAVSTTAQNTTTRTLRSLYTWHGRTHTHVNNLNLINLVLVIAGPMHERTLCHVMLAIQVVFGSVLAFTVRYGLVNLFF